MSQTNDTPPTVQTVQGDPRFGAPWIEIAMDQNERWHWCLWTANGRPAARSGVAYERKKDCTASVRALKGLIADARFIVQVKPREAK